MMDFEAEKHINLERLRRLDRYGPAKRNTDVLKDALGAVGWFKQHYPETRNELDILKGAINDVLYPNRDEPLNYEDEYLAQTEESYKKAIISRDKFLDMIDAYPPRHSSFG